MADSRHIQHLYHRAGFGLNPKAWPLKINQSIPHCVDELFTEAKTQSLLDYASAYDGLSPNNFQKMSAASKAELRKKDRQLVIEQNLDWIIRMSDEHSSALLERMSLFWHGHFACITRASHLAKAQINTIRKHALGNFRDLVLAIAKDPSMIRFLNNQQNRKQQPNENFARELLELFTVGRGRYSEQDIKEAARAFTGWSSNLKGEYIFRMRQHDFGSKTFMGKTGNFNGDDIINIILEQKATARFICSKIYKYFVNENVINEEVNMMSDYFYNNDYDIEKLMRYIFTSDWFYAERNIGTKIKSPVDLLAGMIKTLQVNFENKKQLLNIQRALGQVLFSPPNVAGWPGGKNWIDNSTLMLRLNLAMALITSKEVQIRAKDEFEAKTRTKAIRKIVAQIDLTPLQKNFSSSSKTATQDQLVNFLLQTSVKFDSSLIQQFSKTKDESHFFPVLVMRIMSLPEYQMC